jgi:hypothetical protein
MLPPVQISCIASNWRDVVVRTLTAVHEVNLIHFLCASDFEFCADAASKYSMIFTTNPKERRVFFRKRLALMPTTQNVVRLKFFPGESRLSGWTLIPKPKTSACGAS